MGAAAIVFIILLLVITIALLVKFIRMTDDIKALRKHFVGEEIERTNISSWATIIVIIFLICAAISLSR